MISIWFSSNSTATRKLNWRKLNFAGRDGTRELGEPDRFIRQESKRIKEIEWTKTSETNFISISDVCRGSSGLEAAEPRLVDVPTRWLGWKKIIHSLVFHTKIKIHILRKIHNTQQHFSTLPALSTFKLICIDPTLASSMLTDRNQPPNPTPPGVYVTPHTKLRFAPEYYQTCDISIYACVCCMRACMYAYACMCIYV